MLDQLSVTALKGVGPKQAERLSRLGIVSVLDILFHLPLRYQDRTRITPIGALQVGNDAVIEGEIKAADIAFGRRRSLVCRLQDGTGTATLRFFHFSAAQKAQLNAGTRLRCYGEVRRGASGLELYHPEYSVDPGVDAMVDLLTPIYPSTEGMSQLSWRKLTDQALERLGELPNIDPLSDDKIPLGRALQYLHRPPPDASQEQLAAGSHPYQQQLAFEELVAHNVSLLRLRQQTRREGAPALTDDGDLQQRFLQQLPFPLTSAQSRVSNEIAADLSRREPMLRLLQGDVGAGKTVVATIAALQAIASGYQVALMAPTEILAEQHFNNLSEWLVPLGIRLAFLTGKIKGKLRRQQLEDMANHEAQLIVGTHALFQDEVVFARLGLAIIDEQHRFGVHQRLALKEKAGASHPHQLIMTATPIPRTLAMSAYADLDTSIIDELPPGRQPINTVVIDNQRRDQVVERIRSACADGRQVYWVCTLIEESESLSAQAAEDSWTDLTAALPDLRVGLIHGRLRANEKIDLMSAFKRHEIDLLVATTVIEVGVDVANASLMIIENAERLGLAQLHQLRGRVGRGSTASHCVLMYQSPLSQHSKQRLQVMRTSTDGFYIAEQDLLLRGPGEMLGTRQTGLLQLRVADLTRDSALLPQVQQRARELLRDDPQRADDLIRRWLPTGERFAQV